MEIQRNESSELTPQDSNDQIIYENEQPVNVNNSQSNAAENNNGMYTINVDNACMLCKRSFATNKGLLRHLHTCKKKKIKI